MIVRPPMCKYCNQDMVNMPDVGPNHWECIPCKSKVKLAVHSTERVNNKNAIVMTVCCICTTVRELDNVRLFTPDEVKLLNRVMKAANMPQLRAQAICIDENSCSDRVQRKLEAIGRFDLNSGKPD